MIWSCFWLVAIWADEIEEFCLSLFPQPSAWTWWASHTIPDSLLNAAMGARSVYHSTFWYLPVKRKCLLHRRGFNCVLLPLRLDHSIYLLFCSSDSLWEGRPCWWRSPVKLCGFFIPASGKKRIAAKTGYIPRNPMIWPVKLTFSRTSANPYSSFWWFSSKLPKEDPMHQCHLSLGTTQWPVRRVKRHPSLNMGF